MNPTHSEYCHCECPSGNSYAKLEETLNRVRMLHVKQTADNLSWCGHCLDPIELDSYNLWPCETMKALHGDDDV